MKNSLEYYRTFLFLFLFILFVSFLSAYSIEDLSFSVPSSNIEKLEFNSEGVLVSKKRDWKIIVGYAPKSFHFRKLDRMCNQKNNVTQVGIERKNLTFSFLTFDNTFEQRTEMLILDKKYRRNNLYFKAGIGVLKGYEKEGIYTTSRVEGERLITTYVYYENKFVLFKDYGIMPVIAVGYSTEFLDFEINLFGTVAVAGIKFKI